MSTYVIGDVHGCFDQLQRLLKKISFNPQIDKVILTGDLVNRGSKSLEVLNFCMNEPAVKTVLGNHDLYLLYLMSIDKPKGKLKNIVTAKNHIKIFKWLISRPLLININQQNVQKEFWITHAGVPEIWSPSKAQKLAKEASALLQTKPKHTLKAMWGDHPKRWNDDLTGDARVRTIINYFTRMRFVSNNSKLDLKNSGIDPKDGYKPWFQYTSKQYISKQDYYVFGHWAALNGKTGNKHFIGLDTGCVWKGKLTAIRLDDCKKFVINY